ncbi:competence/damage-inducible protein A [Oscillatoria sp. CS-180]|uniref:competence/damage-inducible protein A n=1 Tax=Oscillatoria sp. CS-180 TaxID=3021720 RepID=UPI00232CF271|nr:competence/damage-inducible protein A [Oscillatoria sp. CS-180]MDB9527708.1 competence/damage-inducible protein A [Oscillatoria sp. CS-180]
MKGSAEVICVGSELLLGDILNTNAQFLAKELAQLGIPHYYQTVVGDNPQRIQQVVKVACERSRLLFFTGGLGPTPDDLTVETLADFFDAPLEERSDVLEDIQQKFARRGREMTPSNRKQALIPKGADVLPNPAGSAPGIIWEPCPGLVLMTFPGVPKEMHIMWQETAVPYLKIHGWSSAPIYSRTLKFWGIGESTLAERVAHLLQLENPTVAPYASQGTVKLRVSAKAATEAEANSLIKPISEEIMKIAGNHYYGTDEDTLESVVGERLREKGQTLSVAESCTGGGLGRMLTAVSGSSDYFMGGIISYDNAVKIGLLGVQPAVLESEGAVSDPVACQMAKGVRSRLGTDWGLSITGIAGPGGGTEEKPVGLVYIGVAGPKGWVESRCYRFGNLRGRDWIRHLSCCSALDLLRLLLKTE